MAYLTAVFLCFLCFVNSHSFDSSEESIESRIIGGSTASKKQFPYQASIRTSKNDHYCGGAIIGSNWILTSALCVYGKSPSSLLVVVGSYKRKSKGKKHNVSRVIVNENFNITTKSNNIALLQLMTPVKYSKYIKRINLANQRLANNVKCTLTGWGQKRTSSTTLANKLRYLNEKTIPNDQCKRALTQYVINNMHICALKKKGAGACVADDGGPLMCNGLLFGILSLYVPCAQGFPDVYTNVTFHGRWIRSKTGVLS